MLCQFSFFISFAIDTGGDGGYGFLLRLRVLRTPLDDT